MEEIISNIANATAYMILVISYARHKNSFPSGIDKLY